MFNTSRVRWVVAVITFISAVGLVSAQADLTLKDILKKNLEASGGQEKLGQVKNLSFRTGGTRQIVSAAGDLKILTGKDPVVTEIVCVKGGKVDRNSFGSTSEITGPQKAVYRTLAKIYAGAFSLTKFGDLLRVVGLKSFGPEKLYHLTAKASEGPVTTHFYLKADDFSLKRLVFQGTTAEGDKYEVNYDFAPFEEAEGLRVPLSWFVSQVGTRGNLMEVTELKANQPLAADFFSTMDLNMGAVKVGSGSLEGNVLNVDSFPNGLFVTTNWTKKDIEQAGFKSGDELTLEGGDPDKGFVTSVVFYASAGELPRPGEPGKDIRVLGPAPRAGETYVLQIMGPLASGMEPQFAILAPISVTKTAK
ncbi:MAG: hypothetical protein ACXW2H_09220 [Candidatus Aminicenantales bacterium]